MTKSTKPPKTYICRFCQYVFKRSEHLTRHERSHTQEKPFGCSVCSCQFSRKDLVVRHERMIHFERKSTTRVTARKARKYEPRRPSQSSEVQETPEALESQTLSSETSERKASIPNISQSATEKTEAPVIADIYQTLPTLFSKSTEATRAPKRPAMHGDESRPTKLQILDNPFSSPINMAPVAPMFGRTSPTTASQEPRRAPDTNNVFTNFAIDPLLQDSAFDPQLDQAAEESLQMFTHANSERQLVSPPLSLQGNLDGDDSDRANEEFLQNAAASAWRLQLEETSARAPS